MLRTSAAQVDVFSLGCILNECWSRQPPWKGFEIYQVNTVFTLTAKRFHTSACLHHATGSHGHQPT